MSTKSSAEVKQKSKDPPQDSSLSTLQTSSSSSSSSTKDTVDPPSGDPSTFDRAAAALREKHSLPPKGSPAPPPSYTVKVAPSAPPQDADSSEKDLDGTTTTVATKSPPKADPANDIKTAAIDTSRDVTSTANNTQRPTRASGKSELQTEGVSAHLTPPRSISSMEVQAVKSLSERVNYTLDGKTESYLGSPDLSSIEDLCSVFYLDAFPSFFKLSSVSTTEIFSEQVNTQLTREVPIMKQASEVFKVGQLIIRASVSDSGLPTFTQIVTADKLELANDNHPRLVALSLLRDAAAYHRTYSRSFITRRPDTELNLHGLAHANKLPDVYNDSIPNPWLSTQLPSALATEADEMLSRGVWEPHSKEVTQFGLKSDIIDLPVCRQQAHIHNFYSMQNSAKLIPWNEWQSVFSAKMSQNVTIEVDTNSEQFRHTTSILRPLEMAGRIRAASFGLLSKYKASYWQTCSNFCSAALQLYSETGMTMQEVLTARIGDLPNSMLGDAIAATSALFTRTTHTNHNNSSAVVQTLSQELAADLAYPHLNTVVGVNKQVTANLTASTLATLFQVSAYAAVHIKEMFHNPDFATRVCAAYLFALPTSSGVAEYLTNWHPTVHARNLEHDGYIEEFPFLMRRQAPPPANRNNRATRIPNAVHAFATFLYAIRHGTLDSICHEHVTNDLYRNDNVGAGDYASFYSGGINIPIQDGRPIVSNTQEYAAWIALTGEIMKMPMTVSSSRNANTALKSSMKCVADDLGRSIVIALSVKYHVGVAMLRAGLVQEDHTDYSVPFSHPVVPSLHFDVAGYPNQYRRFTVAGNWGQIFPALLPVFIKETGMGGIAYNALVKYTEELSSLVTTREVLANIQTYATTHPLIETALALATTEALWNHVGKLGAIAGAAVTYHRNLSSYYTLLDTLYPGIRDIIAPRFANQSMDDLRSSVSLASLDLVTLLVDPNQPLVQLDPDREFLYVLDKMSEFVDDNILPTIAPTMDTLRLARHEYSQLPETLDYEVAIPNNVNRVNILANATSEITRDNSILRQLNYFDAAGNERTLILNELAFSDEPFVLLADRVGMLSPLMAQTFITLLERGNLELYLPSKLVALKEEFVEMDTFLVRQRAQMEDTKLMHNLLTSTESSVPSTSRVVQVRTAYSVLDRINLPIVGYVTGSSYSTSNLRVASKFTDNRGEVEFKREMFMPSVGVSRATINNCVDRDGVNKNDVLPTCFINPVERTNPKYTWPCKDMFNMMTELTTIYP